MVVAHAEMMAAWGPLIVVQDPTIVAWNRSVEGGLASIAGS